MMSDLYADSPMVQLVSFNKLLEHYDRQRLSPVSHLAERAKTILEAQAPYPVLREGFTDLSILEKHGEVIALILEDAFSPMLTQNEIKTATTAFENTAFNSSERFKKILKDAGEGFALRLQNMPKDFNYIMKCSVVLQFHYGYKLDLSRPLFYDIPDANGVMHRYRILYNADFMEILPTEKALELTQEDVDELLESFDNIELWKEKIPPHSFIAKGFIIANMFDVTAENSISEIKSSLIGRNLQDPTTFMDRFQDTFRSLFRLKDIRVGFSGYDLGTNNFFRIYGRGMKSHILNDKFVESCDAVLCHSSEGKLVKEGKYLAISNVEKCLNSSVEGDRQPYKNLFEQGIRSAILAPIAVNGKLLGVLELVSDTPNELNSVNANKLDDVMPYIVSAVMRTIEEEENLIDAVIQHECTTVHPSVYWKFQEEAKRFMTDELSGKEPVFREIVFDQVYPLYGQIDIKDSSKERNLSIQRDLMIQLSEIGDILDAAVSRYGLPVYEELRFRVDNYLSEVKETLYTHTEQAVFDFVKEEIAPVFGHFRKDKSLGSMISDYEKKIDPTTESYYDHRRNYDQSVMEANLKLATLLDRRQEAAQAMFPHYFERYKTDGVEHNMYIGSSISKGMEFDKLYLGNLRLWQLQVMCEMENKFYAMKSTLPVKLDVASLILVYSTPLAIRFRMDEKRFDVDGTYNARYEIIKKRIDKSFIKGSNERLTQKGKLSIVYSQRKDEREYMRYIRFLQAKGHFTNSIEIVELEGLQGVTGLKAIRAEIAYKMDKKSERTYTYDDLMKELSADFPTH